MQKGPIIIINYTVEPLYKGQFGDGFFICPLKRGCPLLEVTNVLSLWEVEVRVSTIGGFHCMYTLKCISLDSVFGCISLASNFGRSLLSKPVDCLLFGDTAGLLIVGDNGD